jgi:uncharacterized protein YjbJ (UPF0337 family)
VTIYIFDSHGNQRPPKTLYLIAADPARVEDVIMSKERIEGAAQKAAGAAKQSIGKAVGNEKLQAEGLADKVVGSTKEAVAAAKAAIHKATR